MRKSVVRVAFLLCLLMTFTNGAVEAQSVDANPVWAYTGSLRDNRYGHTATLLTDGQVLVAGGGGFPCSGNFCYSTVNQSAEIYNPGTHSWTSTENFSRRSYHSATLLADGRVLVVGGLNFGWDIRALFVLNTADVFDPASGHWRSVQNPISISGENNAVLLPNGKVLVVSSRDRTAELFDPITETWSITSSPAGVGSLVLLSDGRVLEISSAATQLYDSSTATWSKSGNPNAIIGGITPMLLPNGKVLAAGYPDGISAVLLELYDPETGVWTVNGRLNSMSFGTATLLPDGRVLFAGGFDAAGLSTDHAELYDPDAGTSTSLPNLKTPRQGHTATLLADGKVLVAAGIDGDFDIGTVFLNSAEVFDLGLAEPISLSINPKAVSQGECYSMTVGNGSNMTLDIQYRLNKGPVQTITRWPVLDANGRAENICTSSTTPLGTFEFTAIRNTDTTRWTPISAVITVSGPTQ
jgi:WD40 repeat protein